MITQLTIQLSGKVLKPYEELATAVGLPVEVVLGRVLGRHAGDPAGTFHTAGDAVDMLDPIHQLEFVGEAPAEIARDLRNGIAAVARMHARATLFGEEPPLETMGHEIEEVSGLSLPPDELQEAIDFAKEAGDLAVELARKWLTGVG